MRKLFYVFLCLVCSAYLQAQKESITIDFGYRPGLEKMAKWGVGTQFRFIVWEKFRLAPDAMIFLDSDAVGVDINVDIHYPINFSKVSFYPIAGLAISNQVYFAVGGTPKSTDMGVNIGFGGQYHINAKRFINLDFKHTFLYDKHQWSESFFLIRLGYGFRF